MLLAGFLGGVEITSVNILCRHPAVLKTESALFNLLSFRLNTSTQSNLSRPPLVLQVKASPPPPPPPTESTSLDCRLHSCSEQSSIHHEEKWQWPRSNWYLEYVSLSKRKFRLRFVVDNVTLVKVSLSVHRFFHDNPHCFQEGISSYLSHIKYKKYVPLMVVI